MHAAFRRIDVIDERINGFRICVVMLERDLHKNVVLHAAAEDHVVIKGLLGMVQVTNEFPDTAFVMEGGFLLFFPHITDLDLETCR